MWRQRVLGIRDVERRDAEDDLAGHAQRLAARRQDRQLRRRAEQRVRERCGRRQQVLAVVEHEQQRRAARGSRSPPSTSSCAGSGLHVERGCDRVRDESWIRDGASSTSAAPDSYDGSTQRASSSASRVFPTPPVPDKRQQPRVPEQRLRAPTSSRLAADERARIRRQARTVRSSPSAADSSASSAASFASSSRRASAQSS